LADTLVSSRIGELARKATAAQVELVLPSNPRGPVGSPELHPYATATEPGDDVASMPWTVPAVEFDVEFALPVLGALGGSGLDIDFDDEAKQDNPRIVPLGVSARYLAAVASHVTGMVARGRVLPVVDDDPDSNAADDVNAVARWRLVWGLRTVRGSVSVCDRTYVLLGG
jgi:hypothetical protein